MKLANFCFSLYFSPHKLLAKTANCKSWPNLSRAQKIEIFPNHKYAIECSYKNATNSGLVQKLRSVTVEQVGVGVVSAVSDHFSSGTNNDSTALGP